MPDYSELSRDQLVERIQALEAQIDTGDTGHPGTVKSTDHETTYWNLFNNMMDEVHFWKLVRDDAGKILTWQLVDINPAAERSWGVTREETVGKTADDIFTSATELFMPVVTKIFDEGLPYTWETYFPDLDQHLQMTSVPFGEYFISTGMDITKIKKAQEEAERASEVEISFEYEPRITHAYERHSWLFSDDGDGA